MTDDLFLLGGLHRTPEVFGNESITMEWNYQMTNDVNFHPIANYSNDAWNMSTNTTHIPFYQVEVSVTEFFIQSALASLYRNGQLVSEPVVLDESAMGSFRSALSF